MYLLLLAYELAAGLRGMNETVFWWALFLGHVAVVVIFFLRRRLFGPCSSRDLFDAWLVTFVLAACLTFVLVRSELPLGFSTGGGHGLAGGGEANTVFMPWLHAALWVVCVRRFGPRDRGGAPDLG